MTNRDIFYRHIGLPSNFPLGIEIERAQGIYMYSHDGKRYIDLVSGVSVSNVGHCHPKIVNAITKQVEKYMHLMVYGELIQSPQTLFAELLTSQLPDVLDCIYYVNAGSEATDGAIKLAKKTTQRFEICAFKNSYHGSSQGSMSFLGNEQLKTNFRPLIPGTTFLRFNDFSDLHKITEHHAAVIIEPIQGEAGVIIPEKGFLNALQQRCKETGTLLIFDEIQTGFGRTGSLFRFQKEQVTPDILCCAKAMGGGMPLGAFIASKAMMLQLSENPTLGHITTFGGHPVSCAAALAQLEILLEEGIINTVCEKGNTFKRLLQQHSCIKEIRGTGLMLAIELHSESQCLRLFELLTQNSILTDPFIFNTASLRIAPPLNITNSQIYECADIIVQCLNKCEQ